MRDMAASDGQDAIKPIRVVQWASGTVGKAAMRAVLDHPRLDLVGVKVYAAEKEGRDAGALCGRPDTGVLATSDLSAILALKPDCVLYMPESTDWDDVCTLLENGISISRPSSPTPRNGLRQRKQQHPQQRQQPWLHHRGAAACSAFLEPPA